MTKNNSQSMATVIETFLVEETVELIHDNDALQKWNDRVEELGLAGQKKVVIEKKSPIPFMWMNSAIVSTFETLCPSKINVREYDKTPIPVEILDLVALCQNEEYFDLVEIWFNEKAPDPVCIGYKFRDKNEPEWYQKHYAQKYLIGRWADVKASLDQLIERAKKIFFESETIRLNQQIRHHQREIEDLQSKVSQLFGGGMPETSLSF